jgi:hypothetical protein
MQSTRIHHRAGAIVAIAVAALAAIAVYASAASAQFPGGPVHQVTQASLAAPPSPVPAEPALPRATEAQAALDHRYPVPPTASHTGANVSTHPKTAATAAVRASKLAAPSDSFNWGDAAIGAAIAMAVVALVIAGARVVRRRTQLGEA